MPGFNGTGPQNQGPMTGRGLGPCGGGMRKGFGCTGSGLRGRRFASAKNELSALEADEKILKEELEILQEEKAALKDQKN